MQIMASKPGGEVFLAKHAQQLLKSSDMRKTAQTHHVSLEARCAHCEAFCEPELHYLELNLDAPAFEKFRQSRWRAGSRTTSATTPATRHAPQGRAGHACTASPRPVRARLQQCFTQRRFLPQPEQQRIAHGCPISQARKGAG